MNPNDAMKLSKKDSNSIPSDSILKTWFFSDKNVLKGELHSNYIFLHFALIGLEWDSITLFTKMNIFSSKTHISTPFAQDIYMAFYLLTWTYFNDVMRAETF